MSEAGPRRCRFREQKSIPEVVFSEIANAVPTLAGVRAQLITSVPYVSKPHGALTKPLSDTRCHNTGSACNIYYSHFDKHCRNASRAAPSAKSRRRCRTQKKRARTQYLQGKKCPWNRVKCHRHGEQRPHAQPQCSFASNLSISSVGA